MGLSIDRENVIRVIDELIFEAQKAPTWKAENALRCLKKELLKEQEPVPPEKQSDGNPGAWESWWYVCGACGREIDYHDKFCRSCGRAVKWE